MKLRLELIIVLLASLTLPVCASAQVTFFGAIKGIFYRQTKDNIVPKKDGTYSLHAFATTTSAGQADSFTVSGVAKLKLLADGVNFSGEKFFKSEAAMNAAFPAGGSYLFTAVGGSLGGQSDSIPVFSNDYPAIAYLPGEMLREVSGIDSKADFILDLAFSSEGAASTNVNFAIYTTSGELIYVIESGGGTTSFTIPQSEIDSLTPGVDYIGQIDNFHVTDVQTSGPFASAATSDGFDSITDFTLRVKK
jgi:hypothetical protein